MQDADLGRKLIASALQERSVADSRSCTFGEAVAAGQGKHVRSGLHAGDICCCFAEYYTALADLLSRQSALGQVCNRFCACATLDTTNIRPQGGFALHGSLTAFCSPMTVSALHLQSASRHCKCSGIDVSTPLRCRLQMRRHHILAVIWRRTLLPRLPWAQKSSWAGQGSMDRARRPC